MARRREYSSPRQRLGILVFSTDRKLRFLRRRGETIFVDGTFKSCPRPYQQVFTIHALVRDHVGLLATVLMLNKDVGSYRQVIQSIKDRIFAITNRRWRLVAVVCDFEVASINAFQTEFPNISIKGCYFHFNQSLWRSIQRL
ncbi:MAG: hypothetical protein AAFY76_19295 [Cyanobacteria bacterium J06649_11]